MQSWGSKLKRWSGITIPLLAIPALLVSGASLLVLLAAVTGAARESKPGDALYPLRAPALELQLNLTDDPTRRAELENLVGRPTSSRPSTFAATTAPLHRSTANLIGSTRTESGRAATAITTQVPQRTETNTPAPVISAQPTAPLKTDETSSPTQTPKVNSTKPPSQTNQPTRTPSPESTQSIPETPQTTKTADPGETPH